MPPKGRPRKTPMNVEDGSNNMGDAEQEQNSSFSLDPPSMEIHAGPGNVDVMAEMSSPSGAPMSMSSPPGTDESRKHVKHHAHSHDDPQPHGYGLRHHHGYDLRDK